MTTTTPKDSWDKLQAIAVLAASLLVPLAVAFVGSSYSNAMKQSENRVKYVELAVSILRTEPLPENAALRTWAVDVINHQSVVPLSAEAQAQLKEHRAVIFNDGYVGSWSTTNPQRPAAPVLK